MEVRVVAEEFAPWEEAACYAAGLPPGRDGACAVFVGTMRGGDANDAGDGKVRTMRIEQYPGMTRAEIERIVAAALAEHGAHDALVIHRAGEVRPGDAIVLAAVWSAHRRAAYAANRAIVEALKTRAPFWKKEILDDGERWVEQNTPG